MERVLVRSYNLDDNGEDEEELNGDGFKYHFQEEDGLQLSGERRRMFYGSSKLPR